MIEQQVDFILLYIDNCEPALTAVLNCVKNDLNRRMDERSRPRSLRNFIKDSVPNILLKAGDREQAKLIEQEFDALPQIQVGYWRDVYEYYLQKHKEQTAS